jgi:2-oxoglutarate ferredoxin oxidoreductase subunit alpha
MVDLVYVAFDLSEKYRVPAMILSDGLLGQMMEPLIFPEVTVTPHPKLWATRGHGNLRKPNIITSLYLEAPLLEKKVRERFERYAEIEKKEVRCEEYLTSDADIVLVGYGASSRIARSAVNEARKLGIRAGLFRPVTLWPFPNGQLKALAQKAGSMLVVELSMGQMLYDVKAAVEYGIPVYFHGRTGGMLPTPAEVLEEIKKIAGGKEA